MNSGECPVIYRRKIDKLTAQRFSYRLTVFLHFIL